MSHLHRDVPRAASQPSQYLQLHLITNVPSITCLLPHSSPPSLAFTSPHPRWADGCRDEESFSLFAPSLVALPLLVPSQVWPHSLLEVSQVASEQPSPPLRLVQLPSSGSFN